MHFYQFNVKDFKASTRHLSHIERALYRELMDMYYESERPITTDIVKLERVLMVKTDEEKQALQNVLVEFFVIKKLKATGDKEPMYHHTRIDRELIDYKYRQKISNTIKQTSNDFANASNENQTPSNDFANKHQTQDDRRKAYQEKVSFLVKSLKEKGIKANVRMKISELQTLFDEYCKQTSNENQTPSNDFANASNENQTPFADAITINQEPVTKNQEPRTKKEKSVAFDPHAYLLDCGVSEQTAKNFVDYKKRKLKKGDVITQQMLVLIKNQAEKTGLITFEDALKIILATGKWEGFKADWSWQTWYESVLISEKRPIPDWLKNQNVGHQYNQPKHIQDLRVNDAWDRQSNEHFAPPELDDEYWRMREQLEKAIAKGAV